MTTILQSLQADIDAATATHNAAAAAVSAAQAKLDAAKLAGPDWVGEDLDALKVKVVTFWEYLFPGTHVPAAPAIETTPVEVATVANGPVAPVIGAPVG